MHLNFIITCAARVVLFSVVSFVCLSVCLSSLEPLEVSQNFEGTVEMVYKFENGYIGVSLCPGGH